MSIKDELGYVKRELSADEKVLESAFRLESFFKKHKKTLIALAATLIAGTVAYNGYEAYKASELAAANRAWAVLEKRPDDAQALAVLKENAPMLYEHVMLLEKAKAGDAAALQALSGSRNGIVADMSRYGAGVLERKPADSRLYKEMVLLEEAYLAILAGDMQRAKEKLELVDERSPAASVAMLLRHATVKVK